MPSVTAKTTRRAKGAPASRPHRPHRIEWLRSPEHAAAYLAAALETGDAGDLMQALRDIAEARGGMTRIARAAGLSRETLYRTLSKRGNPRLATLLAVTRAAGLRLAVLPQ